MEIQAKVTDIFPTEEFTKKDNSGTFRLRKVWAVETGIEYPQALELTFMGNALIVPDALRVGEEYVFSVGITGRTWVKGDKKGINMGLRCWAARGTGAGSMEATPSYQQPASRYQADPDPGAAPDMTEDDLPF